MDGDGADGPTILRSGADGPAMLARGTSLLSAVVINILLVEC